MNFKKVIGAAALSVVSPVPVGAYLLGSRVYKTVFDHTPVGSLTNSLVDNVFRDKVVPVLGSIIHCSLYGVEHTGIYIGDGEIVELLRTGEIVKSTPKNFISGTNAVSIYVACNGLEPIGSCDVAERAISMVGNCRNYNVILDNCHQFVCGCISGNFENSNNFFFLVEGEISLRLNGHNKVSWRIWDLKTEDLF